MKQLRCGYQCGLPSERGTLQSSRLLIDRSNYEAKIPSLLQQRTVYVIDDDLALLRSLKRLLKALGFHAEVFSSTQAFRETADPHKGLCLVLDINLGGDSGLDFQRELVASRVRLPIIFITGNDSEVVRKTALDAGCVAYLQKPFTTTSLINAIEKAAVSLDNR